MRGGFNDLINRPRYKWTWVDHAFFWPLMIAMMVGSYFACTWFAPNCDTFHSVRECIRYD